MVLPSCGEGGGRPDASDGNSVVRLDPASGPPVWSEDLGRPNVGQIRLDSDTRVSVLIHLDRGAFRAARLPADMYMDLGSAITQSIAARLREAGMDHGIFNVGTPVPDEPGKVVLQLFVDRGSEPQSYRMGLLARQGASIWSASIRRPDGRHPGYQQMASEEGEPMGNPTHSSLLMDASDLSAQLARSIEIVR